MNPVLFLCLLLVSLEISYADDEDEESINDGASTSQEFSIHEQCEILSYVDSIVRLMIAEDIEGGNLTDLMRNRFHELEAFHNEIFSYFTLAEYGAQAISNDERRSERIYYCIQIQCRSF